MKCDETKKTRIIESCVLWSALLVMACYMLRNFSYMYGPGIYDDELGYWGAGAFFAGYDWSWVLSHCDYYAWGYGVFLAPLFKMFRDIRMIYQSAIVLNVIFVCASFLLAHKCAKKLAPELNGLWRVAIAFLAVFTTNNLSQAQITWAESTLLFITWIMFYCLVSFLQTQRIPSAVGLAVSSAFLYYVHRRMIGVVLILLLFVLIYGVIEKQFSRKSIIIFFSVFAVCFFALFLFDRHLNQILYHSIDVTDGVERYNSYGSVASKMTDSISGLSEIRNLVLGFLGKVFYFGKSTYMLLYFAMFFSVRYIWKRMKKQYEVNQIRALLACTTLFLLAEIAISTIFLSDLIRNDCIFYGRYAENIAGVLMLVTALFLTKHLRTMPKGTLIGVALVSFGIQVLCGILPYCALWSKEKPFWGVMVAALVRYEWNYKIYLLPVLIICAIYLSIIFIAHKKTGIMVILGLICVIILTFHETKEIEAEFDVGFNQSAHQEILEWKSMIAEKELYAVWNETYEDNIENYEFRFILYDKDIHYIPRSEVNGLLNEKRSTEILLLTVEGYTPEENDALKELGHYCDATLYSVVPK